MPATTTCQATKRSQTGDVKLGCNCKRYSGHQLPTAVSRSRQAISVKGTVLRAMAAIAGNPAVKTEAHMSHGADFWQPPYIHSDHSPKKTSIHSPNPNRNPSSSRNLERVQGARRPWIFRTLRPGVSVLCSFGNAAKPQENETWQHKEIQTLYNAS